MAAEQAAQPVGVASPFDLAVENLLQADRPLWRIAGLGHIIDPQPVRLALLLPAVALVDQVGGHAADLGHQLSVIGAGQPTQNTDSRVQEGAALHPLNTVPRRDMGNLVAEDGRQLGFVFQVDEQPARDGDIAPR